MKILSSIAALFAAVAAFEVFMRLSPFGQGVSPVVYDEQIGMWHRKNFSGMMQGECYRSKYSFDEHGRIKNAYDYDTDRQDVIILGDSHIEGRMVKNENILHNRLFELSGGAFNFLNYALAGTAPTQQFVILTQKTDLKTCRAVLHFMHLDDELRDVDPNRFDAVSRPQVQVLFSSLESYECRMPGPAPLKERIRDVLGLFHMYTYAKKTLYAVKDRLKNVTIKRAAERPAVRPGQQKVQADIRSGAPPGDHLEFNWMQLKGAVYQMHRTAHRQGVPYVVVTVFGSRRNEEVFRAFLDENDIRYLDLLHELEKRGVDTGNLGFSCNEHWSDTTHDHVARVLMDKRLFMH